MSQINTQAQQEYLVSKGLATKKVHGDFSTYKYSRKVMYDYLWKSEPLTLECRGHTYFNPTGELVLAAPRKTFNYLEDGNFKDLPLDTPVRAYRKYNGFLANARMFNGELIVGTTGTLTSNFAELARKRIIESGMDYIVTSSATSSFEIIDSTDPHIVNDGCGSTAINLQWRFDSGEVVPTEVVCEYADVCLADMLEHSKTARHEGWMVHFNDENNQKQIFKLKTDYYVGKKRLMRMTDTNVDRMFASNKLIQELPEQWQGIAQTVKDCYTLETWKSFSDQERRKILEEMYD